MNQTYGGAGEEWGRSVVQTCDGGYAMAGHTASFGAGGKDFWLIKLAGPPPVGGFWIPIYKLELLAPWIGLASLVTVAAVSIVYIKRRRKKQN